MTEGPRPRESSRSAAEPTPGRPGRRPALRGRAFLWKRYDFRESSRVVALLLRDHGVVHALAKGAHRPDSPLLGRLDFLNELEVRLSADTEGLRILLRADLVRERRGLRSGPRFLCSSYLVELCDFGLPAGQVDPELFDLVDGGLALLERCPPAALANVVLGLELRLLAHLGALPDLERCGTCGTALAPAAFRGEVAGALSCRSHAGAPRRGVGQAALAFLRRLHDEPGRRWPELGPAPAAATELPAVWLNRALERRSRLRRHVLQAVLGDRRTVDSGAD